MPSTVGRIPVKFVSGFAEFTADQWNNRILIYSLIAFQNHLPADHLTCWKLCVDACILLCSQRLTTDAILQGHTQLLGIVSNFRIYMANMHLTCHMAECI